MMNADDNLLVRVAFGLGWSRGSGLGLRGLGQFLDDVHPLLDLHGFRALGFRV